MSGSHTGRRAASALPSPARLLVVAAATLASGCASTLPPLADLIADGEPPSVELATVPFFPQEENECGPAALATVLYHSGVLVRPDDLEPQVYLPGRGGSLQTEIVAATRSRDRMPYRTAPTLSDAIGQLASNRPVLVLQNLGLRLRPVWHYAVLVGYDAPSNTVLLRSGTTERLTVKARRFDRSWARAGRWGLVALVPGDLPSDADLDRFLSGAAGLEAVGKREAARRAYRSARERWPDSAWPWLGVANIDHAEGRLDDADDAYREALRRDPANVAARHNLAETLERRGCLDQARREIETAASLARGTALEGRVEATARRLEDAAAAAPRSGQCTRGSAR